MYHNRSAYTTAKRRADLFPSELKVAWEPFPEDEAPGVDEVIELAERLEDRLRAGEKVKAGFKTKSILVVLAVHYCT